MVETTAPSAGRRRRGSKAGLDLPAIVAAARALPKDGLTMQAVADRLQVDRKAVNHYVNDRETLFSLVAEAEFTATFTSAHIGNSSDWRRVCRDYARAFAAAVISAGSHAEHLRLGENPAAPYLDATELVLTRLIGAGLVHEQAARALTLLTNLSLAYARDVIIRDSHSRLYRPAILKDALGHRDPDDLLNLTALAATPVDTYGDAQLELSITVYIAGIESLLPTRSTRRQRGRT